MALFDEIDAAVMAVNAALFGDVLTVQPMHRLDPNGEPEPDPDRDPLADIVGIRSEWSERLQPGAVGMPAPRGNFQTSGAARRHWLTVPLADLAWPPKAGDEVSYADRPGERWRVAETLPDGLGGLTLSLNRI